MSARGSNTEAPNRCPAKTDDTKATKPGAHRPQSSPGPISTPGPSSNPYRPKPPLKDPPGRLGSCRPVLAAGSPEGFGILGISGFGSRDFRGLTDLWSGFQVYPEPLNTLFMSRDCNALSPESLQPSFRRQRLWLSTRSVSHCLQPLILNSLNTKTRTHCLASG